VNRFERLVRWVRREPAWTPRDCRAYAVELEQRMRAMRERAARANIRPIILKPAPAQTLKAWGYADEQWGPPRKDERP
jgi:hypothetical protein